MKRIRLGLIVNPWAGVGGPAALKGSDGEAVVAEALARGVKPLASARAVEFIQALGDVHDQLEWITCPDEMGQRACLESGIKPAIVDGVGLATKTTAQDTLEAARRLRGQVDLLVFVGGDGTARDLFSAVGTAQLCLGVPAGVKMHSAVYGVTPAASAEVVRKIVTGQLVSERLGEVRDLDEDAYRQGNVKARYFGELRVPDEGRYLQQVKCGGQEDERLVLLDIATYLAEHMEPHCHYLIGSGKTAYAVKQELGIDGTLLGVDVVCDNQLVLKDATEPELYALVTEKPCRLILSFIGGQGHLFGRGNQQLSPRVLRSIGAENIQVISTRAKLATLAGRPLQIDTGDARLNRALAGLIPVLTGYDDRVIYAIEFNG